MPSTASLTSSVVADRPVSKLSAKQLKVNKMTAGAVLKMEPGDIIAQFEDEELRVDMSLWLPFNLHPLLVESLSRLQFAYPTEIQSRVLHVTQSSFHDVIAAAETVIIHDLLTHKGIGENLGIWHSYP